MGWLNLTFKDVREHGIACFALAVGFVLVVLIALVQQRLGAFNMSGFEVVRFSLITIIPLIIFIIGNRLVVREYTGGTRRFVEALPIKSFTPLLVKYLIGLVYTLTLCVMLVLIAAGAANAAEDVNQRYLTLLLLKTSVIGLLFWSFVFLVSFTGRIRLVIYVVVGLALAYLINLPSFDETRFAPLAILDRQLFVFERDLFPWRDIIETLLLSMALVMAGFGLALFNEGSIAEQLGKPISRRDMAAFALLGMGCLIVFTTLQKKWETETYELSGDNVLRSETPLIAVSYIDESNKPQAEYILESVRQILIDFQTDVGLGELPQVQVVLNTELETTEIEPSLLDGVLITTNFVDYDEFEYSMLRSIVMHHLLLSLTNARWDYETRHWLLDGFARWWAEGGTQASVSDNNDELFALALLAKRRFDFDRNPLLIWQTITDQFGFEAADGLSYSAILYLEETQGKEKLIELAAAYINDEVGSSSIESVQRVLLSDSARFEQIIGQPLQDFTTQWLVWLDHYANEPSIAALIKAVPYIEGQVDSVVDDNGVYRLEASYTEAATTNTNKDNNDLSGSAGIEDGLCVLRHQPTSAYDLETSIYQRLRDRKQCVVEGIAHSVASPYAPGDRAYVVLEYETAVFHRPVPIWVGRVHIK